ncbi:hypothetical protein K402DRAFT_247310 [Aulographum hederae CBS 113979]|uniref:Uncharacterized protein n=1 Tax=Aulographum hederae CBS 113979 TaxID=1176131 RepID=A0A6G1HA15_9PEZI|nr:hypothetical protein K402DRAFT_247310 [Aulographum hederae CBS 113979]
MKPSSVHSDVRQGSRSLSPRSQASSFNDSPHGHKQNQRSHGKSLVDDRSVLDGKDDAEWHDNVHRSPDSATRNDDTGSKTTGHRTGHRTSHSSEQDLPSNRHSLSDPPVRTNIANETDVVSYTASFSADYHPINRFLAESAREGGPVVAHMISHRAKSDLSGDGISIDAHFEACGGAMHDAHCHHVSSYCSCLEASWRLSR